VAKAKKERKEGERDPIVQHWLSEIESSRKREETYRKEGKRIRAMFAGEKSESTPFNILYSNTETIAPSLYSQVPRPVVSYRFKDGNPTADAAAKAAQRMLEFQLDTNVDGYETFNESVKVSVMDGLLPGRGVARIKYDADVVDMPDEDAAEDKGVEDDAYADGAERGTEDAPSTTPVKSYELVCTESESWDRFYMGYAKKWSKVPWIAYEMYIDRPEADRLFGKSIAGKIKYSKGENEEASDRNREDERHTGERKTALIYKIWDKDGGRKVRFISPQYSDGYLLEQDDPLELTGFFDCPRPLQFVEKTDDMVPTAVYSLYENQATELNSLTRRISGIIKAIKARGIYDSELGDDIGKLMDADENELIPADKSSSLAAEKGMQNAIWFMPLDVLIQTLRELYAAREACKQVIYEVTGISDIVRGASKASETLGAQQLKSQWGTLRIKPKQYEVQRFSRDILRMMVEVAANKFSQDTWAKMTGLPYLTDMQFEQAQAMLKATQAQAQMMPPPMPPQPGQPPPPPNPAAQQMQQQMQKIQAELQKQKWADVLAILKDDVQRSYKIDIETNSTIEPEAAEDQKNISDLMNAIGQFLNGVGPMVAQGILPFQVAQSMLMAITRRFRFGNEIEDQIKQMKPPPPQDDGKAEAAQKQQQQAAQEKAQSQQKAMQDAATIAQLKTQLQQVEAGAKMQQQSNDLALREEQLKTERALFDIEKKAAGESLQNKATLEGTKLDHKKQITGLESKQVKDAQATTKQSESKIVAPIQEVQAQIREIISVNTRQAEEISNLKKIISAPRKRTAIRGKDGRIEGSIDEVMQ
tara:strand:+ start:370 stop:2820 length:2451 start_codon:yes stop_codon:yes gene_type:complete